MAEASQSKGQFIIIASSNFLAHSEAAHPLTAIILAGGKAKPDFTAATGVTNRALVALTPDGRTMLDLVVAALRDSERVERIFVVGDVPQPDGGEGGKPVAALAPGDSLIDNIFVGFDAAQSSPDEKVLLASADIPFITGAAVDDYVDAASALGAEFCYPIVPMEDYRREFGRMKRTTLKLREGEFTGGNIMLARAGAITGNPDAIRAAYLRRKSPIALGGMLGWGLLGRILLSQLAAPNLLTIPLLEKAVGRVLGGSGPGAKPVDARAIITHHASLGTDIDSPEDVDEARRILAS